MVSNGKGATKCSYFIHPECDSIVYSSTFLGGENCPKKPDYSRGYVWKFYPDYDVLPRISKEIT